MSTYVDNVYVAGKSCFAVTSILDDASDFLLANWGLHFKASSQMVMAPLGCQDFDVTDESKWPLVDQMDVLGHCLQNDCGIEACFQRAFQNAWKAFFANCCSRDAARFPVSARINLIKRSVEPVLRFRWTRWPFRKDHANKLDSMQRKMLCIISGIKPNGVESAEAFIHRRGRSVARLQRSIGSWGNAWAKALLLWDEPLQKIENRHLWPAAVRRFLDPGNFDSWPSKLRGLLPPSQLALRRTFNNGRPSTRNTPGFIQRRWSESLEVATDWLADQ